MSDEIAQTTLSQLGGYGKLTSTIGAEKHKRMIEKGDYY